MSDKEIKVTSKVDLLDWIWLPLLLFLFLYGCTDMCQSSKSVVQCSGYVFEMFNREFEAGRLIFSTDR